MFEPTNEVGWFPFGRTIMKRTRFITDIHILVNRKATPGIRWASVYIHHGKKGVDMYHVTRPSYRRLLRVMLAVAGGGA